MYHQPRHYSHHVFSSTRPSIKLSGQPKDSTSGLVSNRQRWIYQVPHRTITATNVVAQNWYWSNINPKIIVSIWTSNIIWFFHHVVYTASLCSLCHPVITVLEIWDQNILDAVLKSDCATLTPPSVSISGCYCGGYQRSPLLLPLWSCYGNL